MEYVLKIQNVAWTGDLCPIDIQTLFCMKSYLYGGILAIIAGITFIHLLLNIFHILQEATNFKLT